MSGQEALIINKIGPYNGPYENNIITYKLKVAGDNIITWHENGKRGLTAQVGDTILGLWITNRKPNYKMSKIINKQLKLL